MKDEKYIVISQRWEIDGMPDGYSLHMNESDRKTYVEEVVENVKYLPEDERSVVVDGPREIEVEPDIFSEVKASRCGIHEHPDYVPC